MQTSPEWLDALAQWLAPSLPFLLQGGKKLGQALWQKGKDKTADWVLDKLLPQAKQDAEIRTALEEAAEKAEERRARYLKAALEELFEKYPALAEEGGQIIQAGGGSAVIGGNMNNSALAVGNGAQAANTIINVAAPPAETTTSPLSEEQLTRAYLESLKSECEKLPLGVVHTDFEKDAAAGNIVLQDVYIDLHVSPPAKERGEKALLRQEREETRVLALEALAQPELTRVVLLGDAGSGKTTLIHFLTLALASLRQNRRGELPEAAEKSLGAYFPIRLILRRVDAGQSGVDMIWNALKNDLTQRLGEENANVFFKSLQKRLQTQPCLIMLDGLDEVPEAEERRPRLLKAIEGFVALAPRSKFLVTARPYAYDKWKLAHFETLRLLGFEEEQIQNFISRFYDAVQKAKSLPEETARRRKSDLFAAIQSRPYLFKLAESPLLLTEIATVDSSGNELPDSRAELYYQIIRLLLNRWQLYKNQDAREIELTQALNNFDAAFGALQELAYKAHEQQGRQAERKTDAAADVDADLLRGVFLRHFPHISFDELRDFLQKRAGVLLDKGDGIYAFPHRSFQEYLAAAYLNNQTDEKYQLAQVFRREPEWWREVILLAIAQKKALKAAVANDMDELVPLDAGEGDRPPAKTDWKAAALAAQAALEVRLYESEQDRHKKQIRRLRGWLTALMEERQSGLSPRERAEAGVTLAKLGDPRFDPDRFSLPNEPMLGFVHIPAGEFLMGTKEEDIAGLMKRFGGDEGFYKIESPQHTVSLEDFYIARYPVTVAQFKKFVNSGYDKASSRSTEGADNHPVRFVTWHDAAAYCNWLTEELKKIAPEELQKAKKAEEKTFWRGFAEGKLQATLPSEAEWEYAARGKQGRLFPWEGDAIQPEYANYDQTGIGGVSAVGMFPLGKTPEGLCDMAGNVWEWTRSSYEKYPYKKEDGRGNIQTDNRARRVLRGGAFFNFVRWLRCCARDWVVPSYGIGLIGFRVVARGFFSHFS